MFSVSTLVTLVGYKGDDKPTFAKVLIKEIKALKKQLETKVTNAGLARFNTAGDGAVQGSESGVLPKAANAGNRDIRVLLDALSDSIARSDRPQPKVFTTHLRHEPPPARTRDVRVLLDALSDAVDKANVLPMRIFDTYPLDAEALGDTRPGDGQEFRTLLDKLSLDSQPQPQERSKSEKIFSTLPPPTAASTQSRAAPGPASPGSQSTKPYNPVYVNSVTVQPPVLTGGPRSGYRVGQMWGDDLLKMQEEGGLDK